MRLLKHLYRGAEHQKLRNLYLALTEIHSDFNGKNVKYYTETIARYSSLSKEWIPKGLKILEKLGAIQVIEDRKNGKFKGKTLVFTPENIEEIDDLEFTPCEDSISEKTVSGRTVLGETSTGETVPGFLVTSEHSLYLEDNKRIEDINNTHTGEKGEKTVVDKAEKNINNIFPEKQEEKVIEKTEENKEELRNSPMEIQQILKKYRDLELPNYDYQPDNYILLRVFRELGGVKLFEALTLMSQSDFVKNNMSINAIFKIENLKKALNGNFKNKEKKEYKESKEEKESREYTPKKKFVRPVYEDFTGDLIKSILNGTAGGKTDDEV